MRFTGYMRYNSTTRVLETHEFDASHYKEAGVTYSPMAGMPVLEAYQLVNKWNMWTRKSHSVYWLE